MASDLQVSLDEVEAREEVANHLGLRAEQIEIVPSAIEYNKASKADSDSVDLEGRLFITWSVKEITSTDDSMSYTKNGTTYTSKSSSKDGTSAGDINRSIRIGYQVFENLGLEASYEHSQSTMEVSSLNSARPLGTMSAPTSQKIENDFQAVKIGLVTNANIADSKNFRLDLIAEANAGVISLNSTYKNSGDVYNGAIGYNYGGEVGARVIHSSGLFIQTGVGINNKVLAPQTFKDGSSSQFNGTDKYVFINVGFSFGGKKRR
jgi:hypothetical protein